jgi:hypothetical protein
VGLRRPGFLGGLVVAAFLVACGGDDSAEESDAAAGGVDAAGAVDAATADAACSDEHCYQSDEYCDGTSCAEPDGSCERAALSLYEKDADGPLLYGATQRSLHAPESFCLVDELCSPDALCEFELSWYDPQMDFEGSVDEYVYLVTEEGMLEPAREGYADPGELRVRGCFPVGTIEAAVQVRDDAGHMSNALCLTGESSLP